jgi:hypothetical protein
VFDTVEYFDGGEIEGEILEHDMSNQALPEDPISRKDRQLEADKLYEQQI